MNHKKNMRLIAYALLICIMFTLVPGGAVTAFAETGNVTTGNVTNGERITTITYDRTTYSLTFEDVNAPENTTNYKLYLYANNTSEDAGNITIGDPVCCIEVNWVTPEANSAGVTITTPSTIDFSAQANQTFSASINLQEFANGATVKEKDNCQYLWARLEAVPYCGDYPEIYLGEYTNWADFAGIAFDVSSEEELKTAISEGKTLINLTNDITLTKQLTIDKAITIYGNGHSIERGDGLITENMMLVSANVTLNNVTIDGMNKTAQKPMVLVNTNATLNMNYCTLQGAVNDYNFDEGQELEKMGGAVNVFSGGINATNCQFLNNNTQSGKNTGASAIYLSGAKTNDIEANLVDCTFNNNASESDYGVLAGDHNGDEHKGIFNVTRGSIAGNTGYAVNGGTTLNLKGEVKIDNSIHVGRVVVNASELTGDAKVKIDPDSARTVATITGEKTASDYLKYFTSSDSSYKLIAKDDKIVSVKVSSGGGFSGSYNHPVNAGSVDGAKVTFSKNNAVAGDTVTITVTPDAGKQVKAVTVTDEKGNVLTVTKVGDNKYSFTMPAGKVNVEVTTENIDYNGKIVLQINNKNVLVDNKTIKNDVAPTIKGERTLVPIRVIVEALGGDVDWNGKTRTVTIALDGKVLTLVIDKMIPGFGQGATIMDNRTYVPVRYIAEYVGAEVEWIAATQQIVILK